NSAAAWNPDHGFGRCHWSQGRRRDPGVRLDSLPCCWRHRSGGRRLDRSGRRRGSDDLRLSGRSRRHKSGLLPASGRRDLRASQGRALSGRVLSPLHEVSRENSGHSRQPRWRDIRRHRPQAAAGVPGQLLRPEMADGGPVVGVAGDTIGFVIQDRAVRSMQFLPGDTTFIFNFTKIVQDRGCTSRYGYCTVADTTYQGKRKFIMEANSSMPNSFGGQRNAGNTALEHMEEIAHKIEGLGNWNLGGYFPTLAAGINKLRQEGTSEQKARANALDDAVERYVDEVKKFYCKCRGGQVGRCGALEQCRYDPG